MFLAIPTVLAWLFLAGCTNSTAPRETSAQASTNFDLEHVAPFLEQISPLFASGFSKAEATRIAADVAKMDVETTREWSFDVQYQGKTVPMRVAVFMDDIGAPDVFIFSTPELASRIQAEMVAFAEARGL